jgi:ribosomal 50S subunit-associated protein YjgA (DUF615 family)
MAEEVKKNKPLSFASKSKFSRTVLALQKLSYELDSKQAHTSFGKMPLSNEPTTASYAFKKARREDQAKVFLGELTVLENMAKGSPGPVYKYEDQIKFKEVSL